MNILVVDDNEINRKVLTATLEAEGHRTRQAADGVEALAILENEEIDDVVSDILMPNMDGYRLCYEVRHNVRLKNTPFIFYTNTYTSPADEQLALDVGADKFLTKPSPVSTILDALHDISSAPRRQVPSAQIPPDEMNILRQYNQVLVIKLEERNAELERVTADLQKREKELLRVQRIESIGAIAGGVAHDLNNVLAPILMAVQMLRSRATDEQSKRIMDLLEASTERGSKMVRQVLAFFRGFGGEHIDLGIPHLLQEIESMIKETFPKAIDVIVDAPKDLWRVSGDPTQLHQIMMNLCVNARDAMPHGGRLTISARNVIFDQQSLLPHPKMKSGPYVTLTVTDTGMGISEDALGKIFEPFYTTKEQDKGTGIGLSSVMNIVKGHHGFIDVQSEVARGSKFRVSLPAIHSDQTDEARRRAADLPSGNGETILVIDDEAIVREITTLTLEMYGYKVLTARDGSEAVSLYSRHMHEIKAVLSDMDMPIMDGPTTAKELRRINPGAKIILASGSAAESSRVINDVPGVQAYLQKPFAAETLLTTLREILTNET